jgi:hypothetical protein
MKRNRPVLPIPGIDFALYLRLKNRIQLSASLQIQRMKKNVLLFAGLLLLTGMKAQINDFEKHGSFYFSWGYNTEWYTHSDIHISQPALNSDFTFINVVAHDHKGWDNNLFHKDLSIPQYNYRIGYFFNKKQDWGFEINFDHTKYVVTTDQTVRLKGKVLGRDVDSMMVTGEGRFLWQLNNGANFLQFNLVKKLKLIDAFSSKLQFDVLLKAGVGPVIPHVENTIFGINNVPHFQFGGWNADADVSLKLTFFKYFFLEYQTKVVYGRYFGLRVYDGLADQHFGCFEVALVAGGTFKF